MQTEDEYSTFSVSCRLKRTTTEVAFIKVLVTSGLIIEQPDYSGRMDVDKLIARAIELEQEADAAWSPEISQVQPHPIQDSLLGLS